GRAPGGGRAGDGHDRGPTLVLREVAAVVRSPCRGTRRGVARGSARVGDQLPRPPRGDPPVSEARRLRPPVRTLLDLATLGPALAALATLPFLFMEAHSMWGGNIPSTLAGEFAFSLGLALAVLFIGALRRSIDSGRGKVWCGVLVALIGLSHGYTLLWAGFASLAELISTHDWWRRVRTLVAVHGLGVLLMAFFLLQLFGYGPWTTAYNHSWPITGWREVLPPILWPAAIVTGVTTLTLV